MQPPIAVPEIVSVDEWRAALDEQIALEKARTRERDRISARRRRLPMVKVRPDYLFDGPAGTVSLLDLFEGRRQLIVYHFMFGPDWKAGCDGCSWVVDAMTHPAHPHARDTTLVLVSRAPLDELERYRRRMGWQHPPWYSSRHSDFNSDMGVTSSHRHTADTDRGERHGVSVFLRHAGKVYRSCFGVRRGVEYLGSLWSYLDLTPYGRQERWEDSHRDGFRPTPARGIDVMTSTSSEAAPAGRHCRSHGGCTVAVALAAGLPVAGIGLQRRERRAGRTILMRGRHGRYTRTCRDAPVRH